MNRILPYIALAVALVSILFYLDNYRPDLLTDVLIQVDVFGVTRIAEKEQERLARINALTDIPYEEKQVLIQRTVFMGASPEMVKLALLEPQKVVERGIPGKKQSTDLLYYIYFLQGDKRPTVLVFQEDKLINAYKGTVPIDDPDIINPPPQ